MRSRRLAALLALVLVLGVVPMTASAGPGFIVGEEYPVSLAPAGQVQPDIDYPWIVWKDERAAWGEDTDWGDLTDIYAYNFITGEESVVCTAAGEQSNPSISGDWVTYSDNRADDGYCDIYAYNLETGEERLVAGGGMVYRGNPAIDGDVIVHNYWDNEDPVHYGDIWGYSISEDESFPICQAPGYQREPEIGDGWVVWRDDRLSQTSIFGANIADESECVTIAAGWDDEGSYGWYTDPSVDDGICVAEHYWYDRGAGEGHYAIVAIPLDEVGPDGVDPADIEIISTVTDDAQRRHPVIADGLVTWHDARIGAYEVYGYDLATGTETLLVAAEGYEDEENGGTSAQAWVWEKYAGRTATGDGIVAWHDHRVEIDEDTEEPVNEDYLNHDDLYVMFTRPLGGGGEFAGSNRYETAVKISQDTFPEGSDTVIIATGLNFPDALAGSSLAGVYGAPVLLVGATVPAEVAAEIDRLGAEDCFILGGPRAVSPSVQASLAGMGLGITRLGGIDRFGTAELIAEETLSALGEDWDGTAFLVTGYDYPDALSAGPLSSFSGSPIFLGGPAGVSDSTRATMDDLGVETVYVLGGPSVITLDAGPGVSTLAIAGANRYETAVAVAEFGSDEFGLSFGSLAIATGERFPDALTAGPAQGIKGGSMLITPSASLHSAIAAEITDRAGDIGAVSFIGGTSAISTNVRNQVNALLAP